MRWYFTLSKMNMSWSPFAWATSEIILMLDEQWQIYIEVTKIKIRHQMSSELKPQTAWFKPQLHKPGPMQISVKWIIYNNTYSFLVLLDLSFYINAKAMIKNRAVSVLFSLSTFAISIRNAAYGRGSRAWNFWINGFDFLLRQTISLAVMEIDIVGKTNKKLACR